MEEESKISCTEADKNRTVHLHICKFIIFYVKPVNDYWMELRGWKRNASFCLPFSATSGGRSLVSLQEINQQRGGINEDSFNVSVSVQRSAPLADVMGMYPDRDRLENCHQRMHASYSLQELPESRDNKSKLEGSKGATGREQNKGICNYKSLTKQIVKDECGGHRSGWIFVGLVMHLDSFL